MKTPLCRIAAIPLAAAFVMGLALPLAALARPAHTRPAAASQVDGKVAKSLPTTDVALPARRSCQPADDSEYTDDVAGGAVTEDASSGIQVGMAEPGEAKIEMLEMSPEEEAAFDAAVAAHEQHTRESGRCGEGDADTSTDE